MWSLCYSNFKLHNFSVGTPLAAKSKTPSTNFPVDKSLGPPIRFPFNCIEVSPRLARHGLSHWNLLLNAKEVWKHGRGNDQETKRPGKAGSGSLGSLKPLGSQQDRWNGRIEVEWSGGSENAENTSETRANRSGDQIRPASREVEVCVSTRCINK